MDVYAVALFVHIVGLVPLFGALMLLQRGGMRLRAAETWDDVRTWLHFMQPVRGMFTGASVILLVSGSFMTWRQWGFATPWIAVSLVALVAFAAAGAMIVGRGLARIGKAAERQDGPLSHSMRLEISRPDLWAAIAGMNGGAIGIVWLMTTKPGWLVAVGVPVALTIVGGIIGASIARRGLTPDEPNRQPTPRPHAHDATWVGGPGS